MMFPGEDMLQEGIAAFQAGDRAKAHELLSEVVKVDPENEQAWYYLAASESDPALRKEHLERVLEINPENAKAREVLDRIKARETPAAPTETVVAPRSSNGERKSRIRALDPSLDPALGAAESEEGSFKIPVKIPGAPERVTPEGLARAGIGLLRTGVDVLLRKPGVYADEVAQATWWRFWLIAGTAALPSAVLSIFNALFLQIRFTTSLFNIFAVLLTPFFAIAIMLTALYVGCYVSHRWALTQGGGTGELVKHAYTVAVVWAPITLIITVVSFVFNLIGFGTWLLTLLISIYEVYLISDGFERLYAFSDPRQKWFTAGVLIAGIFLTTWVLRILLGGIIVGAALPFALF